jgi:hypothetical protein
MSNRFNDSLSIQRVIKALNTEDENEISTLSVEDKAVFILSYPLIFSRAKMQLEVGPSLRRLSYDES